MKKVYKLRDLDCAHCASQIEAAVKRLEDVKDASVNFLTQKFTLEAEDEVFEAALEGALKAFKKIEPDCSVEL
ncbi:MAG: cation transporter [Oscillospiraceae bacterium]|nr:cation transporter [Oscillospiraceae bacterium]